MAIVKCKECGKEISDTISSCPHCGFVMKRVDSEDIEGFCLAGLVIAVCSWFADTYALVSITSVLLSALGLDRVKSKGLKGKYLGIIGLCIGAVEAAMKLLQIFIYYMENPFII